jgi:NADH dehydrogenase
MATGGLDVVTGAFGYSGAAIARELLVAGRRVRTLTARPAPATAAGAIEVHALDFDDPVGLVDSLQGATTLYNTYWVRLPRGGNDHRAAAANSRALFHAARRAGVERIVHVSITHPDIRSPYTYFRGKAEVERALVEVGIPYAVLRPAVLFGGSGGVLFNNIAWLLRHLPVFAIGGRGDYRVRAIHVDDLARLALSVGATRTDLVLDAVGPERPTFIELVDTVRQAVGSRARLVRVPGPVVPLLASALGVALRDVLLSREEFRAMADGLADTEGPASGETALSSWVWDHREMLGRRYAKDLR